MRLRLSRHATRCGSWSADNRIRQGLGNAVIVDLTAFKRRGWNVAAVLFT